MKYVKRMGITAAILGCLYVALGFALAGVSSERKLSQKSAFRSMELIAAVAPDHLPEAERFPTRDGRSLAYRIYPGPKDRALLLVHGASSHSFYLGPLAKALSRIATVYTPDVRGHGLSSPPLGDIDYIGQLDDDLSDLIAVVKKQLPRAKIILGGHSQGGGIVLRAAGSAAANQISGYVLIAPFVDPRASMVRQDAGFTTVNIPRIIGLRILNSFGFSAWNKRPVLYFNIPEQYVTPQIPVQYTYRLTMSTVPGDRSSAILMNLKSPLLVLAAAEDELFVSEEMVAYFGRAAKATVRVIPNTDHLSVVLARPTMMSVDSFIREL